MSDLVPANAIEAIVGVERHQWQHWAKAVSTNQRVYILHSHDCLTVGDDLRLCEFSQALDNGIDPSAWVEDQSVQVEVHDGILCMITDES